MHLRIDLFLCFVHLTFIFAKIDLLNQCSSRNSSNLATTCGSAVTCSSSSSCLNVMWTEFKPYSYKDGPYFKGIIPGIFLKLMGKCCDRDCWRVNLTAQVSRQSMTAGKIDSHFDIVLPYGSSGEGQVKGMSFVSLVAYPSVVYITKKQSAGTIPRKLISAVWNAWPVLIMALLLSLASGILLWFLEFWRNPEEFPSSFFKGSWEGFWWAFVSMTTVGYGDRAPRSILGRTFAIFWILIGICICSIFTATLTTSLTSITLEEQKTLDRAKVGAIRSSLEAHAGLNSKAKVISYNSTSDLWRALRNDDVEGILLDSYFSATSEISGKIEDNDYKISQTVQVSDKTYGILVKDANLTKCFKMTLVGLHYAGTLSTIISNEIQSEVKENEAEERSDSIFNPTGDIFWPSLYACIGMTIAMLIIGLIWEFFLKEKVYKRGKTVSQAVMNVNATNLDQMEKEMIAGIQKMFSVWRAQRDLEIGIASGIQVEDVEQRGDNASLKQNGGEQFGMKQPEQHSATTPQFLQHKL